MPIIRPTHTPDASGTLVMYELLTKIALLRQIFSQALGQIIMLIFPRGKATGRKPSSYDPIIYTKTC
jgi:hypothetical protein